MCKSIDHARSQWQTPPGCSLPNLSPSLTSPSSQSRHYSSFPLKRLFRIFHHFHCSFIWVACNWILSDHNSGSRVNLNQVRSSFHQRISNIQNLKSTNVENTELWLIRNCFRTLSREVISELNIVVQIFLHIEAIFTMQRCPTNLIFIQKRNTKSKILGGNLKKKKNCQALFYQNTCIFE